MSARSGGLTAEKRAREQRLRDRRARKEAKRAAKKAARDAQIGGDVEQSSADSALPPSNRLDAS